MIYDHVRISFEKSHNDEGSISRSLPSPIYKLYYLIFELILGLLSHFEHKAKLFRKLLIKYEVIIRSEVEKMIWRRT